jgi:hypothetical protein
MKTSVLKMLMLPVAAFPLASAGAVTTTEARETTAKAPIMTGYIHNPTLSDCDPVQVDCTISGGHVCQSGSWTVFDKDTPVTCNKQLRRP